MKSKIHKINTEKKTKALLHTDEPFHFSEKIPLIGAFLGGKERDATRGRFHQSLILVAFAASLIAILLCDFFLESSLSALPLFKATAVLFLAAGLSLHLAAFFAFVRHRVDIRPLVRSRTLIEDGIFRFTRNPIYIASFLYLLAALLGFGASLFAILFFFLYLGLVYHVVRLEEDYLKRQFGEVYVHYTRKVGRWF